ncbi:MAG: hypothetical protein Q8N18_14170 [Opitutaceae bacterium]|nr:hypothetical protein [Opitutaceae bacterium]
MAHPAYRKAGELTWLWLAIGLAGVAAQLSTLFLLSKTALGERLGLWLMLITGLPLVLALIFGAWLLLRFKRLRIGVIATRLGTKGLRVAAKPSAAEQAEFAAPLGHLLPTLNLQNGPAGIQWCATHGTGATALRLFEHEYCTGSGKTTQSHLHTVAAWPAGHLEIGDPTLATAPWFMLARTSWLLRRVTREQESNTNAL